MLKTCLGMAFWLFAMQAPAQPTRSDEDSCEAAVCADFDGDGRRDVAMIDGDGRGFVATLQGGKRVIANSYFAADKGIRSNQIGMTLVRGKVLQLDISYNRAATTQRWRYDTAAKDFRLIGYEREDFGNVVNDDSGKSSFNLLTGEYLATYHLYVEKIDALRALPTIRLHLAWAPIYMKTFNEKMEDRLQALGQTQRWTNRSRAKSRQPS